MLAWLKDREERKKESQKIDDLTVLKTCWSGTLAILSSKVNGPVGHGSAQKCPIWLMEAFEQRHFKCVICALLMWPAFFPGPSLHMAYYRTP